MSDSERVERNAAMRENMTSLLEGISRQTEELKQAQEQAAAVVGTATSKDRTVTVEVNAAGIVTDVQLDSAVYKYNTPQMLSESLVLTIQAAARNAREQADEAFAPVQNNIPDLPDIFPEAPSVKALIPGAPEVPSGLPDDDGDLDDEFGEDDPWAQKGKR
ncbi:YbaB/EbfC family nucleoid-associated protein [Saccharopolyspora sp. HNM0983]|uniref:YbaB/EbfC family nucleoid-associated protein n=1 Tax=Saccharopolyspora montiporae TaxID=2781240 RepID=A0A929B4D2_9PSEU|nr:YbaB/EbfC family nucleoid-associated protein [Saccharopolyspora sp. HNM0983]MBE9372947.1 YbaB/EbfC family nucleoid-associated protein [Saccharopolyspora sp. HNM0983]